jgi:hypothetical protein
MNNTELFIIPDEEIKLIGVQNQIYGCPTLNGLKKLKNSIELIQSQSNIDYIYGIDLGCGDGKIINYMNKYLSNNEWIGIELSKSRINLADNLDNIIEGNLLDLSYKNFNFIYVNNLCFDDELNEKLENKIYYEFNGFILASNQISSSKLLNIIDFVKIINIDMNWQRDYSFYLYKKF